MNAVNYFVQRVFNCQTDQERHLIRVLSQPNTNGQWERETRVYLRLPGALTDRLVRIFEQEDYIGYEPLVRAIFETTSVGSQQVHRLVLAAAKYDKGPVLRAIKETRIPLKQTTYSIDMANTYRQTPLAVAMLNTSGQPRWAVAVAALLEAGAELQAVPNSIRGFRAPGGAEGRAIRERLQEIEARQRQTQVGGNLATAPARSPRIQVEELLQHPQPELPHEGEITSDIPSLSHGDEGQITVRFSDGLEVQYWIYAP